MRAIAQIISWLSLVALTVPSILYLAGSMDLDTVKRIMLVASLVWFLSATPWMWKEKGAS
ncbi:MAG: hypothetical protein DRP66_06880 [Planctomycetota bacterium]|nr:MAG: hypothetical protein DRP66_06880 [Planctomycetota bacterium]